MPNHNGIRFMLPLLVLFLAVGVGKLESKLTRRLYGVLPASLLCPGTTSDEEVEAGGVACVFLNFFKQTNN